MAENSSTIPATGGNTSITGTTDVDSLSGGGGSDTIVGGAGGDRLSGDAPLQGQWQYRVYTRDFSSAANQTQFIESGALVGNGYVDDFGVRALRNTLAGSPAGDDQNDYGVVYRSNLAITTGGSYTFSTTSDDGSRIIIRDASNNIVFNLNNDFHQAATFRSDSVTLAAGQTYSIEVYFWENQGADSLSATITLPGIGQPATNLATSPLLQAPPLAPGHLDGNDSILGEAGQDTITGGGGNDQLYGGADNDSILGEAGRDLLDGGDGADLLFGGADQDTIYGGGGNDSIDGSDGADQLYGGADQDTIYGGAGSDTVDGGVGADSLEAGDGDDSVSGNTGNDTIYYGSGNDTVFGGDGNDIIDDIPGDQLYGRNLIYGGSGEDRIWSGFDADTLYGDSGNDTISAEFGNDSIYGGSGADQLFGGGDNDFFTMFDGDFAVGDLVDGGSTGNDFDSLDLRGYGWARTDITYTTPDRENGFVRFFDASGGLLGQMSFIDIEEIIPCFTSGTLIETPDGHRAVESIRIGDLVMTLDDGPQVVRWVGHRSLSLAELVANPSLQPVEIAAGALGDALPRRTLSLSPQHRVLFSGAQCELCFGEEEVLAPAIHLAGLAGVRRRLRPVTYVHLMFDAHQIVRTEGVWSESFQPGERILDRMPEPQRNELFRIFPELAEDGAGKAARSTLCAYETRVLLKAAL